MADRICRDCPNPVDRPAITALLCLHCMMSAYRAAHRRSHVLAKAAKVGLYAPTEVDYRSLPDPLPGSLKGSHGD